MLTVEICDPNLLYLKWDVLQGVGMKNQQTLKCIDIEESRFDDGAKIIVYPCHLLGNQRWILPGDGSWGGCT